MNKLLAFICSLFLISFLIDSPSKGMDKKEEEKTLKRNYGCDNLRELMLTKEDDETTEQTPQWIQETKKDKSEQK